MASRIAALTLASSLLVACQTEGETPKSADDAGSEDGSVETSAPEDSVAGDTTVGEDSRGAADADVAPACPLVLCGSACVDTQVDRAHCGSCGVLCKAGEVCSLGKCSLSCSTDLTDCSGSCRDTKTDRANCGVCGTACKPGEVCSAGKCAVSCSAELAECSGSCRDLSSDRVNCGACGTICKDGEVCASGKCAVSCGALTNCGGTCTNTAFDPFHCGSCAGVCATGQACLGGKCVGSACSPGASEWCYGGPLEKMNIGACKIGSKTCNTTGTAYGSCVGEVRPSEQRCEGGLDDDCDGVTPQVLLRESFKDNSAGWDLGALWQLAPAAASTCGAASVGNDPAEDHTSTGDNMVAGNLVGACIGYSGSPSSCIASPNLDTSAASGPLFVSYWRHLHSDRDPYMVASAQASSDGGASWTTLWQTPKETPTNDLAWTWAQHDITAYLSKTTRVRFCISTYYSGTLPGGGWSLDDVSVSAGQACR